MIPDLLSCFVFKAKPCMGILVFLNKFAVTKKNLSRGSPHFKAFYPPTLNPGLSDATKKRRWEKVSLILKKPIPSLRNDYVSIYLPVKFAAFISLCLGSFLELQEFIMTVKADCVVEVVFLLSGLVKPTSSSLFIVKVTYFNVLSNSFTILMGSSISGLKVAVPVNLSETHVL